MIVFVNETKKQRAIKEIKDAARLKGEDMTKFVPSEQAIKELYLKYGGLLREEVDVIPEIPVEKKVEELKQRVDEVEEIVKPKAGRPKKIEDNA